MANQSEILMLHMLPCQRFLSSCQHPVNTHVKPQLVWHENVPQWAMCNAHMQLQSF